MWRTALILFACLHSFPAFAGEIRVSAAVSVNEVLKALQESYSRNHPGVNFIVNTGGSGALANQISRGAPADIFISAHPQWMDFLVNQRRVSPGTIEVLAANRLVFVGPPQRKVSSLTDLLQMKRIAIGSPRSVPAGQYAQEALTEAGVYEKLLSGGQLVMTQDVRQALVHADRGEVDGAIVYRTDAALARSAAILFEIPEDLHTPATYPMAMTEAGAQNPEVQDFFAYLQSPEAKATLEKYGFVVK
jgi:molybdate transport system substrate-binding protein